MQVIDYSNLQENKDAIVDDSASYVRILANQVEGMKAVYEEANKLREEQRVILDRRHVQVLDEMKQVKVEIEAETRKFLEAISTLEASAKEETAQLKTSLLFLIESRFNEAAGRMQSIEEHQKTLDAALEQEIKERNEQTEMLIGKMRDQLIDLDKEIKLEVEIRKADVVKIKKILEDKILALDRSIEDERFHRDVQVKGIREQLQQDLDRTDRRQLRVIKYAEDIVDALTHAVRTEAKTRGATQTSIVQCVTVFVEKFKNNLDAEVNLNKN